MKSLYGYLILFISFFGIIFLQNYVDGNIGVQSYNPSIKQKILHNGFEKRLNELELVVDSIHTVFDNYSNVIPEEKKPLTMHEKSITSKNLVDVEYYFPSLNDAAKIRDSKNELSLLAQQYINLAYQMGGDDWYGAENIWNSDTFKEQLKVLGISK